MGIFTTAQAGGAMASVAEASLEAGRGLKGDRYYNQAGTFSEKLQGTPDTQITLIELEEVEQFNRREGLALAAADLRRNLVIRGVRLNDLVDRQFQVGAAVLEGIRLCEPCAHLARTVDSRVLPGLVHKAGLRARIVAGATVRTGDPVSLVD